MSDDDNVTPLPVRFKPKPDEARTLFQPWEVKKGGGCQHTSFIVDEKRAEVECATCGETLNPMWVLRYLATDDRRMKEARKSMREERARLDERRRTKCEHCGKITRISRR